MLKLRHILFPYDFSDQGRQLASSVRAVAKRFDAQVTLFSVVPPVFDPVPAGMGTRVRVADDAAEWERTLRCRLDRALVEELADLPVERVADGGDPALRIVDFAQRHAVDLMSSGRSATGRRWRANVAFGSSVGNRPATTSGRC
jgi:hypothetical protein